MRMLKLIPLLVLLLATSGCAMFEKYDETRDWSAGQLYDEAKVQLKAGDLERAIELFETVQARYPFGRYAQQAQLETAYAYYKFGEPDQAISAAERFIKMHPQHPHIDYVYYLKGLANFNRGMGLFARFKPGSVADRDLGAATRSFYDFEALVSRFPQSRYAEDSRLRMIYLRNNLAAREILVARYYMKRGAYLAAANRAKYVIENYQKAPAMLDALELLVAAYRELEFDDLAADAENVLKLNYPERAANGAPASSWWRRLFD